MLALRPEEVKMDRAGEGFVGELSEIMAKVFDGIQNLDRNGVLGDPRPATAEAGKKYLEDIIEFLYRWVGSRIKPNPDKPVLAQRPPAGREIPPPGL
jgi:creatinine amidohydrolase